MTRAQATVETREFEFTGQDFKRVCRLIHGRVGIALNDSKQPMVYSRVGRRLRSLGLTSFNDYLDTLEGNAHSEEWQEFTNALTTNLTAFFREHHHFPVLAELIKRASGRGRVTLWCSAASTGEEPYSMAMTAIDALADGAADVRILATDVDTNVLRIAQTAVYPAERLEKLPAGYAQRFFLRGRGGQAGEFRVRDEVRRMIVFRQLNLLDERWPISGPLDAIFCRNVMIYFDKPMQRRILEQFAPLLRDDGLLFMGHSESLQHAADLYRLRGKTIYEPAGAPRPVHRA